MFQVSKLLRSKVLSTLGLHLVLYCSACGQGRVINLYVCLVVHTDTKLQQAMCL